MTRHLLLTSALYSRATSATPSHNGWRSAVALWYIGFRRHGALCGQRA